MRNSPVLSALLLIACVLILASCATSRQVEGRTELVGIPQALTAPCDPPVEIVGDETFADVIDADMQDGANLAECRARHMALVDAVETRDEIQGAKP